MPFNRDLVPNPLSKGHLIERRTFHVEGDSDLAKAKTAVPFDLKGEPVASCWWQRDTQSGLFVATGVSTKKSEERIINPILGADRGYVPGDVPATAIELRRFANLGHKTQMLKVCPPQPISGLTCVAWWELSSPDDPKSAPVLCTGLRASKGVETVPTGDGLDHATKADLLTKAVTMGIRDVADAMEEGEIIAKIRAHQAKAGKGKK